MKKFSLNTLAVRLITALTQSLILYFLFIAGEAKAMWPATQPFVFVPVMMVALFVPLLIIQGVGSVRPKIMAAWGVLAGLVLFGVAYYSVYRQIVPSVNLQLLSDPSAELLFFTSIALFIAQSLIVSGNRDNKFIANYATYFDTSWKLSIQIAFAAMFTIFFWILLWLGASLFKLIHLDFFKNVITQSWFAIPATTLAVATALHITDVNEHVVRGIRVLVLVLLSWLLPLITGIISVFLLSLFSTGLSSFFDSSCSDFLLLCAAVILVILINATYQDGYHEKPLQAIQRYAATLASCLLVPIMALSVYALNSRVQQTGWTVSRIESAFCMIILVSYAIGYALAVFFSRSWLKLIEYWNIGTAFLMLAIYLAVFTPLADPARVMVQSQVSRLQTGKTAADKFDFNALRSQGFRFGRQALQDMQDKWQGTNADLVRARAKLALASKLNVNAAQVEEKSKLIIVHPQGAKLPETFLKQSWQRFAEVDVTPACLSDASEACHAWVISSSDKTPMILILDNSGFSGFEQDARGVWSIVGTWRFPYACSGRLNDAAAQGRFKLVPQTRSDIEVLGVRIDFTASRNRDICNKIK